MASLRNPRVVEAARLQRRRGRREAGCTLLEGPHLLGEAVAAGVPVARVFALEYDAGSQQMGRDCGAEIVLVDDRVLRRLATTEQPQSPVSVISIPPGPIPPDGHLLVAWGVGDPGNVGALIRVAAAFGIGFAYGPGTADPWSPKVLRAAAGGHFRVGVAMVDDFSALRSGGRRLVAAVPRGGIDPAHLPTAGPMAILVGDEAAGLPEEVVAACDLAVTVPMPGGAESLNAAVAGAVVAYEVAVRRRRGATAPGD